MTKVVHLKNDGCNDAIPESCCGLSSSWFYLNLTSNINEVTCGNCCATKQYRRMRAKKYLFVKPIDKPKVADQKGKVTFTIGSTNYTFSEIVKIVTAYTKIKESLEALARIDFPNT